MYVALLVFNWRAGKRKGCNMLLDKPDAHKACKHKNEDNLQDNLGVANNL